MSDANGDPQDNATHAQPGRLGLEGQILFLLRRHDTRLPGVVLVPASRAHGSDVHGVGHPVREEGQGEQVSRVPGEPGEHGVFQPHGGAAGAQR